MIKSQQPATAGWITQAPAKRPTICNLCGGRVIKTTNDRIYGKIYGNGKCYLCLYCGAYVGCHDNGNALGVLTTEREKSFKILAHNHFDFVWKHKIISRGNEYSALAKIIGIPKKFCHFGYFNEDLLQAALLVMEDPHWFNNIRQSQARLIQKYGELEEVSN